MSRRLPSIALSATLFIIACATVQPEQGYGVNLPTLMPRRLVKQQSNGPVSICLYATQTADSAFVGFVSEAKIGRATKRSRVVGTEANGSSRTHYLSAVELKELSALALSGGGTSLNELRNDVGSPWRDIGDRQCVSVTLTLLAERKNPRAEDAPHAFYECSGSASLAPPAPGDCATAAYCGPPIKSTLDAAGRVVVHGDADDGHETDVPPPMPRVVPVAIVRPEGSSEARLQLKAIGASFGHVERDYAFRSAVIIAARSRPRPGEGAVVHEFTAEDQRQLDARRDGALIAMPLRNEGWSSFVAGDCVTVLVEFIAVAENGEIARNAEIASIPVTTVDVAEEGPPCDAAPPFEDFSRRYSGRAGARPPEARPPRVTTDDAVINPPSVTPTQLHRPPSGGPVTLETMVVNKNCASTGLPATFIVSSGDGRMTSTAEVLIDDHWQSEPLDQDDIAALNAAGTEGDATVELSMPFWSAAPSGTYNMRLHLVVRCGGREYPCDNPGSRVDSLPVRFD